MENLGLSPLPDGTVRLFSEYKTKDLAYVGGTTTKYVPIGDRVEVNVGRDQDITIQRRLKDQKIANVVARQYKRRLDNTFVQYYDLIDYDETFFFEEEIVSGKPVVAKTELERRFDANVVLWGERRSAQGLGRATSRGPTSICTASPARSRRSIRTTSSTSSTSSRARSSWCSTRVTYKKRQGRAGAERREEAGAAVEAGGTRRSRAAWTNAATTRRVTDLRVLVPCGVSPRRRRGQSRGT